MPWSRALPQGYAGAQVAVAGAGPDGVFGTGDDTASATTTGADGSYRITGLPAGRYRVTVALPADPTLPTDVWSWETCRAGVGPYVPGGSTRWAFTAPDASPQDVSLAAGGALTGVDFRAENGIISFIACA